MANKKQAFRIVAKGPFIDLDIISTKPATDLRKIKRIHTQGWKQEAQKDAITPRPVWRRGMLIKRKPLLNARETIERIGKMSIQILPV